MYLSAPADILVRSSYSEKINYSNVVSSKTAVELLGTVVAEQLNCF